MELVDEPVRGAVAPPEFSALPGIEQARAILDGSVGPLPMHHLTGVRLTQVAVGTVTAALPISPWLLWPNGQVDSVLICEIALSAAVLTTLPPGVRARLRTLQWSPLRFVTPENRTFLARARVARSSPRAAFAMVEVEDADGRMCAHATGTFGLETTDPRPAPPGEPLRPVDRPRYPTPDPWRRAVPEAAREVLRYYAEHGAGATDAAMTAGELAQSPAAQTFGWSTTSWASGRMRASSWLRVLDDDVTPGALCTTLGAGGAAELLRAAGTERMDWSATTFTLLRGVEADGQALDYVSDAVALSGDTYAVDSTMRDASGAVVARLQGVGTAVDRDRSARAAAPNKRVLRTVMFTDIVESTRQAAELGDRAWSELRERHDRLVRTQLAEHDGHEIKATGDGFLATFESPSEAVGCAARICHDIATLGIAVRAGIHTGEVEVADGDISGMAVNLAARVESAAHAGDVLVTESTRLLVDADRFGFVDAGEHELKGIVTPVRLWRLTHADA